jgi:hypothetical protein
LDWNVHQVIGPRALRRASLSSAGRGARYSARAPPA